MAGEALEKVFSKVNVNDISDIYELKTLLEDARGEVDSYDKDEENNFPGRCVDFSYELSKEENSVAIFYESCNNTKIECWVDFNSNSAQVSMKGQASSIVRRSGVTDNPLKFKSKTEEEILPDLVLKALEMANKYNQQLEEENITGTMQEPLRLKVSFDGDGDFAGKELQQVRVFADYHAFYGVGEKLGFEYNWAPFEQIYIKKDEDLEEKIKEYFEKIKSYNDKIKE